MGRALGRWLAATGHIVHQIGGVGGVRAPRTMPRRCSPPWGQPKHTYYKQSLPCLRFGQHTWQKGSAIVPALRFLRRSVGVALCIASRLSLASVPPSRRQIFKPRSQDLAGCPRSCC